MGGGRGRGGGAEKLQFTCDLPCAALQKNNISCGVYWEGIYIAFLKKIAFSAVLQWIL